MLSSIDFISPTIIFPFEKRIESICDVALKLTSKVNTRKNSLFIIDFVFNYFNMLINWCLNRFDGLFLNADAGFDTSPFRNCLVKHDITDNIDQNKRNGRNDVSFFDDELYKQRFVIERTNAWLDAFKAILVRFETKKSHWKALNMIAFSIILLR